MTRRSPPSHLIFLPPHIPTPVRGALKYTLPSHPPPLPTFSRVTSCNAHSCGDSQKGTSNINSGAHPYECYISAQEGSKPPWVRSRGIDLAEKELGDNWGLSKPKEVVLYR
ncbi:uncharacterized protein I206_103931 [Kwoniella pini CBS 10737]|uniref:Uncharacterized protein n=1 Tax=Kwoniella pini CBS 10737 TaxID=1296096 RepID=A0A1B9I391_9TREE|nr:uncharacterized protein I206_04496 [Kwoniella pini CBS 10737]OCF49965.1 hypothetical protein I206_04496 [Kwoniella pini CBS 10737]